MEKFMKNKVDWVDISKKCPLAFGEYMNYQTKKFIELKTIGTRGEKTEITYSCKPLGMTTFHLINKADELLIRHYFERLGIIICTTYYRPSAGFGDPAGWNVAIIDGKDDYILTKEGSFVHLNDIRVSTSFMRADNEVEALIMSIPKLFVLREVKLLKKKSDDIRTGA